MGRVVHFGGGEDAIEELPGAQTFLPSFQVGSPKSVQVGARAQDGLDQEHGGNEEGAREEEGRAAILHALGVGRQGRGDAQNSQTHLRSETVSPGSRRKLQSTGGIFIRRQGSQRVCKAQGDPLEEKAALYSKQVRFSARRTCISQLYQGKVPEVFGSLSVPQGDKNETDDRARGFGATVAKPQRSATLPHEDVNDLQGPYGYDQKLERRLERFIFGLGWR